MNPEFIYDLKREIDDATILEKYQKSCFLIFKNFFDPKIENPSAEIRELKKAFKGSSFITKDNEIDFSFFDMYFLIQASINPKIKQVKITTSQAEYTIDTKTIIPIPELSMYIDVNGNVMFGNVMPKSLHQISNNNLDILGDYTEAIHKYFNTVKNKNW